MKMNKVEGLTYQNGLLASMTALAIILHIFRFPFPLATFLKYDLSGVPLLLLAMFMPLKKVLVSVFVFSIGVFILGGDPIGALMKGLAELSSIIGLILVYKKVNKVMVILVSAGTRTLLMTIANLLVTPLWLLYFARACDVYSICLNITLMYIPAIALFNITLGIVIAGIAIAFEKYLSRIVVGWRKQG